MSDQLDLTIFVQILEVSPQYRHDTVAKTWLLAAQIAGFLAEGFQTADNGMRVNSRLV